MSVPSVSVIMPVYNAEAYVAESIASILAQSTKDLELIIVNDGSTDASEKIIKEFQDPRIIYHCTENRGVANALNTALTLAGGQFIARQDADDVSLPTRFAEQLAAFSKDSELAICGTWAKIITAKGQFLGTHKHPTLNSHIQFALLFDCPFVSTSVMFRREKLIEAGNFDPSPMVWDDYDQWSRLARTGKCLNLPNHLVLYREVSSSLSRITQNSVERKIEQRRRNIRNYLRTETSFATIENAVHIGIGHRLISRGGFMTVHRLYLELIDRISTNGTDRKQFRSDLGKRMLSYHLLRDRKNIRAIADRLLKELLLIRTSLH